MLPRQSRKILQTSFRNFSNLLMHHFFLLMQDFCPTLAFKPLISLLPILSLLPLLPHHCLLPLAVRLHLLIPPPDSLRVLQWNTGGLWATSTELLHFLLSHPIDLICIQESDLNSSSSFRIPGFFTLQCDHTHSWYGILSHDPMHASATSSFLSSRAYPFLNFLPPLSYSFYTLSPLSLILSASLLWLCRGQPLTKQLFLSLF